MSWNSGTGYRTLVFGAMDSCSLGQGKIIQCVLLVVFSVQDNLGGPTSRLPGKIERLAQEPCRGNDGTFGDQEGVQPQISEFTRLRVQDGNLEERNEA